MKRLYPQLLCLGGYLLILAAVAVGRFLALARDDQDFALYQRLWHIIYFLGGAGGVVLLVGVVQIVRARSSSASPSSDPVA